MASPRLTIVMPYYRAEKYFYLAAGSILAQTFEDWRLLIVEDGDPAPPLHDPRIQRISLPENRGFAAAAAEGLDQVDTEWMTFHDADDWSEPHRLERLMGFIGDRDAVLAPLWFHKDGQATFMPVRMEWATRESLPHLAWWQPGLYRTSAARSVGLLRELRLGAADSLFTALIARHHNPVVDTEATYHLNRRPGSLMWQWKGSPELAAETEQCQREWEQRR